jgi:cytochrome b561
MESKRHMRAPQPMTTFERYSLPAQLFHWLTAALVIAAYIVSPGGTETRIYAPASDFDRSLHELLGMTVFALTLLRLSWRAFSPPPKSPPMPLWMERGAKLGHWAIYALLVLVPLTSIFGAWLEGHPLTLLGLGNIQPWLSPSRPLGLWLADLHGWLGNVLIWLAGFHAVAALYHHFWRRDPVLLSMLPGREERVISKTDSGV